MPARRTAVLQMLTRKIRTKSRRRKKSLRKKKRKRRKRKRKQEYFKQVDADSIDFSKFQKVSIVIADQTSSSPPKNMITVQPALWMVRPPPLAGGRRRTGVREPASGWILTKPAKCGTWCFTWATGEVKTCGGRQTRVPDHQRGRFPEKGCGVL